MRIRNATLKDSVTIARNNVDLARESENDILRYPTALAGARAIISDRKKGFYIVAEEVGLVVGQLMITFEWSDWRNRMMWWIQSVFVSPGWRKKGVFRALLAHIRKKARKSGVKIMRLYVYTKNRRGIHAYEGAGLVRKPYFIYQYHV
jgi:GNAT superfamily N-acetyltransferase